MQFEVLDDRLLAGGRTVPFVLSPNRGVKGNPNARIEPLLIVVHFTADHLRPDDSVEWFKQRKSGVSAHLVVGRDASVTQMVEFDQRAWHCDPSEWNGKRSVNGMSIGIEVDNPGKLEIRGKEGVAWFGTRFDREKDELVEIKSAKYGHGLWVPYTPAQLEAVRGIIAALLKAYPSIVDIRGHDEICVPAKRKNDPGPLMDMDGLRKLLGDRAPAEPQSVGKAQQLLVNKGYWPGDIDGLMGPRTRSAIRDFQEQNGLRVTGELGTETWVRLTGPDAKPMPTRTNETAAASTSSSTTLVKRGAEGTATMTLLEAMAAPPPPPPPGDPVALIEHADQALGHLEKGRAVVERSTTLVDWLITWLSTPQGLRAAITLGVCLSIWLLAHRIDLRARWARLTGQNNGG